jgi:lactoylglutathione lyase
MQVRLRALEEGDLGAVHALISNIDVVRYMMIPLTKTVEQSRGFLEPCIPDSEQYVTRAIAQAGEDTLLGLCGIVFQKQYESGELWYLLDPGHHGRGITTLAAREMLRFGFEECRLHRIWATCCPENAASMRVLEKCGMRHEGYLVRNLRIQGVWHDTHLYAVTEEEWRTPREHARLEHAAVWVSDLDAATEFYRRWFHAQESALYESSHRPFRSRFLTFDSGARIELMQAPGEQPRPAHIAISVGSPEAVDALVSRMSGSGIAIVSGPRRTGDGYYEAVVAGPDGVPIEITV